MANEAKRQTLVDYQYNVYNQYLDQLDGVLIKYGKKTGMPIQYWHIRIDESKNYNDLNIQNAYKHYVYDLLHFVPTINATPITYQIGYNMTKQGTSNVGTGSFVMYLIDEPLPGDLFRYYSDNAATDKTEIFRVTEVRYMRTSGDKLKMYQIDFETAPILLETANHLRINTIQCWNTELFRFLNEEECGSMTDIVENRDKLIDEINKWYDRSKGWYGKCQSGTDPQNPVFNCGGSEPGPRPMVFLNTILKRLKRIFDSMDIKPIFGTGTAKIPIDWILQPDDYWDTFTCLSFQQGHRGEIFNFTEIINDGCTSCPPELVEELKCHSELYRLIKELVLLMQPLLTQDQLQDRTCDRKCCDATDPAFIQKCVIGSGNSIDFDELFWDSAGDGAAENAPDFCDQYTNALCIPLYITWKDGAHWPEGGLTA